MAKQDDDDRSTGVDAWPGGISTIAGRFDQHQVEAMEADLAAVGLADSGSMTDLTVHAKYGAYRIGFGIGPDQVETDSEGRLKLKDWRSVVYPEGDPRRI